MSNAFENVRQVIEDFRDNSLNNFTIDIGDDRDFQEIIAEEKLTSIDLSNVPEEVINKEIGLEDELEGKTFGVFAKGKKLFETTVREADFRLGGSYEKLFFDNNIPASEDLGKIFPELDEKFNDVSRFHSVRDFAQSVNIDKLTFREPEQENTQILEEKQASQQTTTTNTQTAKLPTKKILAGLAVLVGLIYTMRR